MKSKKGAKALRAFLATSVIFQWVPLAGGCRRLEALGAASCWDGLRKRLWPCKGAVLMAQHSKGISGVCIQLEDHLGTCSCIRLRSFPLQTAEC